LSEAAMHKIIAARQADTPVEAPATAFLKMNCSNVSKTPEQSQRDDHNYGDHTEYLNFCRTVCCISLQANCKTVPRLSKTAHFSFSHEAPTSRSMMQADP
jgi:hypothetical protein